MTEVMVRLVRPSDDDAGHLTGRWRVACVIPCRCKSRLYLTSQAEAVDAARHRTARPAHARWRATQHPNPTSSIDEKGAAA